MHNNTALAYQGAAAEGATHIGLLVLVYNSIVGDLLRAADAVRNSDIGVRCSSSAHALTLLGHVESWLDVLDDADLVVSLRVFYSTVRARIMQLQAAPDASQLENLANLISETGVAWKIKERGASNTAQNLGSAPLVQQQEDAQIHAGSRRLRVDA